jgi:hypothetical protein
MAMQLSAQKAPIKYGEVTKDDLLNNTYQLDTTAAAVILCDYGYFNSSQFKTTRTLRIKFLKPEGFSWANHAFNLDVNAAIRGITYNLEGDKIVETKLKGESIYKTRITEDYYQMRIAMPNVKVGSIIDIQFSYDGIPNEWDFQMEIPVMHSELNIETSPYVTYSKNYFGYIPLPSNSSSHWVLKNVPAFKAEPYMTSSNNFRTRFEFDISAVSFPGYYKSYAQSWESVRDILSNATYFGVVLNSDGYLRTVAKELRQKYDNPDTLIKAAYSYVKQITWNGETRFTTDATSINSVFKEGKGNSAEINLALVQLLRKLDFDAGPVVMSSRDNGMLAAFKPSITKLNYVIAGVFTGKDTLLLDASERYCPYYLLPKRALNMRGKFMDKNRVGWVEITPKKKDKEMVVFDLNIADDQTINGKISFTKADYAALDFRKYYSTFNSDDEYLKDFKEGKNGVKINTHTILNLKDLTQNVQEDFDVTIKNALSEIDGDIYLIPMLFEQISENPFKSPDRLYPVDYAFMSEKTILMNYTLPDGYTLVSAPSSLKAKLPENAASMSYSVTVLENKVSLVFKFNINRIMFVQNEYTNLRVL